MLDNRVANGEIPRGRGTRQKAFLLLSVLEEASFINRAMSEDNLIGDNIIRLIIEET